MSTTYNNTEDKATRNREKLYNLVSANGESRSREEFLNDLSASEENRRDLFNLLEQHGYKQSYDEFSNAIGYPIDVQTVPGEVTSAAEDRPQASARATLAGLVEQAREEPDYTQHRVDSIKNPTTFGLLFNKDYREELKRVEQEDKDRKARGETLPEDEDGTWSSWAKADKASNRRRQEAIRRINERAGQQAAQAQAWAEEDETLKQEGRYHSVDEAKTREQVMANVRQRFAETETGKGLAQELHSITDSVTSRIEEGYMDKLKQAPAYAELVAQLPSGYMDDPQNAKALLQTVYGDKISEEANAELAPYYEAYDNEVRKRYGVDIDEAFERIGKQETTSGLETLRASVDSKLEAKKQELNNLGGYRQYNAMEDAITAGSYREQDPRAKQASEDVSTLRAAQKLLSKSENIIREASKKGKTNFVTGVGRGMRDTAKDVDTWTMGITEFVDANNLQRALSKAEKGESLTEAEEALLDASVANMATQVYFGSDLGRGYKAGQTTMASVPFMLEMIANPISSTGSAIAKRLLKYGLKKWSTNAVAKGAARLIGDAVAAAGMEATSGLGRVAAGTMERLNQNYVPYKDENGNLAVDKTRDEETGEEKTVGLGEAIARSAASTFLENQSEMVFNAFAGGRQAVANAVMKVMPGAGKRTVGKVVSALNRIKNSPIGKLEQRAQFHGIFEEYMEEVYNNMANVAMGEMSMEDATSLDTNLDTFLGLTPTSLFFGGLHLGYGAYENQAAKRQLRQFANSLSDNERKKWNKVWDDLVGDSQDLLDELTERIMSDERVPDDEKERLANQARERMSMERQQRAKAMAKKILSDEKLPSHIKKAFMFAIRDMMVASATNEAADAARERSGENARNSQQPIMSDDLDQQNQPATSNTAPQASMQQEAGGTSAQQAEEQAPAEEQALAIEPAPPMTTAERINAARGFKRAERKARQALSPDVFSALEQSEDADAESFAEQHPLSGEQREVVDDYLFAKPAYQRAQGEANAARAVVLEQTRSAAEQAAVDIMNEDGTTTITLARGKHMDKPVYIVGGRLAVDDEGNIDVGNSTETVYYKDPETGERKMGTARDFAGIEWQMTREQYVERAVRDAEEAFNAKADAELQTPDIHEPAYGITFIHDGQRYMLVMPSEDEPGKWDAQPIDEEGRVTGASIQVTPEEYYADQEAALWPALPGVEAEEQAQPDVAEQATADVVQPQAENAAQGNEQQPAEQQQLEQQPAAAEQPTAEQPEPTQQLTATEQSQLPASEEQPAGQQVATEQAQTQQQEVDAVQPQAENAAQGNVQQSVEQPTEQQATPAQVQPQQTALQRIPKDQNGDPLFDEADADTAWDALVEAADGSEEIASRALSNEVARIEKELEKMKKQPAKNKTGGLMGEIRAEKEKQKAIDDMQKRIDHRKAMLAVPANRAEAEQRRQQEEKAAREAQEQAEAEQRRIQQERERAEQEEAARREAETLRGVPDWTQDTDKAARTRGYRRVEAGRYDRQEPVEATRGAEVDVRFRSAEAPVKGRYAIVDAGQLQPSHNQGQRNPRNFILDAQPKDRADGRLSETAAQRIANEIRPEEITTGTTAYSGAPVVNARGEVIQGNNRADALKYMHENTPESAAKYKAWLKGHAEEFGLTAEQVDAMERPVLVRMLDVDDETAVRLGQYTAQDTESGGIERIDPKRALAHMGKKLSGFFSLLMENGAEDETFAQLIDRNGDRVIKWMANSGFISATQAKSAFDRKGDLTAEAKNDLKKLMFESVFRGGNAALAEKFSRIPVKTQNAILATAWRDNDNPESQRMNADLQESIEALYELMNDPNFAKSKDMKDILRSIRGWEAMIDFDTATGDPVQRKGKYSNFALRLAATYKAYGQKATESILNRIYDLVQGKAEATLFEEADSKPRTLAEAVKEVLNIEYDGKNRGDLLGSDTTGSETGRSGILGNTPNGEQATSGERRTDGGAGTAGVLGTGRGVAADNTEREGVASAPKAAAEAQGRQGANVAQDQDAPRGGAVPANEEQQATQRKQDSPSGEQLQPQESHANEAQPQSQAQSQPRAQSQSQNAAQADNQSAQAVTQEAPTSGNGAAQQQEHGTERTSQQAPAVSINGKGEIDIINEAAENARAQQLREKFHKRPGAKPAKDNGPTAATNMGVAQEEGRRANAAVPNAGPTVKRRDDDNKAAAGPKTASKTREQYLREKAARKAQEARDKLKKGMGRLGAGVPVDVMLEALTPCVEWAACQIELGVRKLADFTKSLVMEFGEAIRPYAKMLFTGAQHLVGLEDIDSEFYTEGSEYAMLMIKNNGMSFPDFVQMMREEFGEAFDPYLKSFYDTAREMLEMQGNPIASKLSSAENVKSFSMQGEESDKTVSSQAEGDSQSQERSTNQKDEENADVHSNDTGSIHERTGEPAQPGPDNEGSDSGRDDTSSREDGGRRARSDRGRVSVGATDENAGTKDGGGGVRREHNGSRGDNHADTGSGVRSDDAGGRGHSGGGRRDNAGAVRGADDERNPGRNGHNELEGEKQAKGDSKGKPSGSDDRVPYVPTSKAPSAGTVMPALQAAQLYDALHSDVFGGDIDQFVVGKLKYKDKDDLFSHFSAEQIEGIALAIAQMDKGGGFILGDMTGIGKGRQGAALIRYAVLQGLKPVYFTAKPQLFSDVYRDLVDIGSGDLVPFIFASSQEGAVTTIDDNGDMHVVHAVPGKSERQALYDELAKTGKLPKLYDFVLCTYSQIQNGTQTYDYDSRGGVVAFGSRRADAAARSGQKAREALALLMRNSFAILDEAHLAAGRSDTGLFLQSALAQSKATLFMSATYAKRPDNMPLYSGNTGMALSGLSPSDMIKAVIFGGLPLQEAISQQLVKSGQMVRRERDFTGVTIDWMQSNDNDKDRQWEAYGAIISIFRVMMDAQQFVLHNMADVTTAAKKKGLIASATPFSSLLFPMFNQAVFALKAQQLADIAIEQIKAGKKPVITYNYTGDSVMDGMRAGEQTANDFNFILSRYFESLCTITFKNRQGNVIETHHISEYISNKDRQALLSSMRSRIIQARTGLPCSPVDTIVDRLKAAGYNVGEISGRKFSISADPKTGSTKIVARRKASPRATAAEFNSGAIDALLLNRSGSTGISLHASRKFADQRPRVMISAQSQLDINDEVQIRGRIDRSGQVARGSYIYLTSLIPAEQRIQLSLRRKLKSLDANATSSQKSGFSDNEDVPDFINKYGDMAVLAVLRRDTKLCLYIGVNPEELEKLGSPAQSVLARLVFLSPKLQEEVFDEIVEEYRATVKRAVDDGTYDLDVTAMDFGARVEARWLLANGVNPGAGNMFADNAYVDNCKVRRMRKPYSTGELAAEMAKARANHRTRSQVEESAKAYLAEKRKEFAADEDRIAEEARIAAEKEWSAKTNDANELAKIASAMADRARSVAAKANREKLAKIEKHTRTILEALASLQGPGVAAGLETGMLCTIPDNDNDDKTQQAVFLGYHISKNFSPSTSYALFAVPNDARTIRIQLPVVRTAVRPMRDYSQGYKIKHVTDEWWATQVKNAGQSSDTDNRLIITGNLLVASSRLAKKGIKGRLVSFSMASGEQRLGILLPRKTAVSDLSQGEQMPISNAFSKIEHNISNKQIALVTVDKNVTIKFKRNGEALKLTITVKKREGQLVGGAELQTAMRNIQVSTGFGNLADDEKSLTYSTDLHYINERQFNSILNAVHRVLDVLDAAGAMVETEGELERAQTDVDEEKTRELMNALRTSGKASVPVSDVVDLLHFLDKDNSRAKVIDAVSAALSKSNINVQFAPMTGTTQGYFSNDAQLCVNSLSLIGRNDSQDTLHTLLHEMIHAMSSNQLRGNYRTYDRRAVRVLNDLFKLAKGRLSGYYSSTNCDEMVAELSDPDTRAELAALPVWAERSRDQSGKQTLDIHGNARGWTGNYEVTNALAVAEEMLNALAGTFDPETEAKIASAIIGSRLSARFRKVGARDASSSTSSKPARVEVAEMAARLSEMFGVPVHVVDSAGAITDKQARKAVEEGGDVKGWYDPNTGEVYLYAPNIESTQDAMATYAHEVIAHKGMEGLLGKERYAELCERLGKALTPEQRKKVEAYEGSDDRTMGDEYIARIAETLIDENGNIKEPTTWEKVKAAVRDFFRDVFGLDLTDADIKYMLWRSAEGLRRGRTNEAQRGRDMLTEQRLNNEAVRMRRENSPAHNESMRQYFSRAPLPVAAAITLLEQAGIPVEIMSGEELEQMARRSMRDGNGSMKMLEQPTESLQTSKWDDRRKIKFTRDSIEDLEPILNGLNKRLSGLPSTLKITTETARTGSVYMHVLSSGSTPSIKIRFANHTKPFYEGIKGADYDASDSGVSLYGEDEIWKINIDFSRADFTEEEILALVDEVRRLNESGLLAKYKNLGKREFIAVAAEYAKERGALVSRLQKEFPAIHSFVIASLDSEFLSNIDAHCIKAAERLEKAAQKAQIERLEKFVRELSARPFVSANGYKVSYPSDYTFKGYGIHLISDLLGLSYGSLPALSVVDSNGREFVPEYTATGRMKKKSLEQERAYNAAARKAWEAAVNAFWAREDEFGHVEHQSTNDSEGISATRTEAERQQKAEFAALLKREPEIAALYDALSKDKPNSGRAALSAKDRRIYGATVGGKVYINGEVLDADTSLHEYTHLWDTMVQRKNPELWKRGVGLMKQTPLWDEVMADPNYAHLTTDDEIASEVHARLVGEHGSRLLEEMAKDESTPKGVIDRLRQWLKDVWASLKETLSEWTGADLDDLTLEQFNAMTMRDLSEGMNPAAEFADARTRFSIRQEAPPQKTGTGYKAFVLRDGKLYPPMVANPGGADTPVGVWLDADAAPVAGQSKTGRPQVKAGGKGTQGGSGKLAYRPGWHLGTLPYAKQFNRLDASTGQRELFPADFVWAEVEYAMDVDYQAEAEANGMTDGGKYRHSYAGLQRLPENGSYIYRTNPDPTTDPWIITGAMRVNRLLTPTEVDNMVREAGREPQRRQDDSVNDEQVNEANERLFGESESSSIISREELSDIADELSARLHTPVRIVESVSEVDNTEAREALEAGEPVMGWYDTETGEVVLYRPNIADATDATRTFLHEVVGHKGLRGLFGEENYDKAMLELFKSLPKDVQQHIIDEAMSRYNFDIAHAMDEYLAEQAERGEAQPWWGRAVSMVRDLLRAVGFGVELSDADVRYLLWRSSKKLEKGEEGVRKDNAMRDRLGISPNSGTVRFRTRHNTPRPHTDSTAADYERSLKGWKYKAREAYQDSMLALKKLQEVVSAHSGRPLKSTEDAYTAENHLSSKNTAQCEQYGNEFFRPMMEAIAKLIKGSKDQEAAYREVCDYAMAKHGLERNEVFARRDAEREAEEFFAPKYKELEQQLAAGDITKEKYAYEVGKLDQKKAKRVDANFEKNRGKDYSGLTALTGEDDVAAAEKIAQQMVDDYESKHDTADLWGAINAATKETLRKSYDAGLMTKEVYDKVRKQFKYYIPLRGFDETTAEDVYEYLDSETSPVNSVLRSAVGRKSLADDPFATIGNMAESTIFQANRNLMKQRFLEMALAHPSDVLSVSEAWYVYDKATDSWRLSTPDLNEDDTPDEVRQKIKDHEAKMRQLALTGEAKRAADGLHVDYRMSRQQEQEHAVHVKRGGKEYIVYVNGNPRAAQALNGKTNPSVEQARFWQWLERANRWMAANFTTRSPAFIATNLSRDLIYSMTTTAASRGAKYGAAFVANIPRAMAALARHLSGKGANANGKYDRYYREFLENGGETGYANLRDVNEYKKFVQASLKQITGKRDYLRAVRAGWKAFALMNRWAENVSRLAAYITARERGANVFDAVSEAKEVTVNFNKKGAGYKTSGGFGLAAGSMRSLFLFFNAGVQGLNNFGRIARQHPRSFITLTGGFAAAGFMMPVLNKAIMSLMGDGDDDDYYANLSEWTRRNNICVYAGDGKFVTIPLPIELRAFYGLGEMAYQAAIGNDKTDGRQMAYDAFNQIGEILPLNPLGNNGDIVATFTPDALKPFMQHVTNKDFTGKPIRKENDYNERMPEWTKTYAGTNKQLKALSEWANEVTGGDKYTRGWANLNPATVEHYLEGYFGGMATVLNQAGKTIYAAYESVKEGEASEDLVWRNAPVLSRFVGDATEDRTAYSKLNRRYYELYDAYKDVQQRLNGYKSELGKGNFEYLEPLSELQNSDDYKAYQIFNAMQKRVSKLQSLQRKLPEAGTREARKSIEEAIVSIKQDIIEAIDGVEEQ